MRGLFFKVFGILWLAQSLIFILTTALIISQHFPTHNVINDALDSSLHYNAMLALQAYEAQGCAGFSNKGARNEPHGAVLLSATGETVCSTPDAALLTGPKPHTNHIDGQPLGNTFIWIVPITAPDGTGYQYIWFQPPPTHHHEGSIARDFLHFAFPQLPVAIAVGGLATFVLVLLFTRPIVRLRKAARELASGNLTARVPESSSPTAKHTDEFRGLNHDFNHMAERLESLVAAQRLLLRDVSHELRSPLARLSVALELAREDATSQVDPHLNRIERETGRLNLLIGQLLTLSSMEATEQNPARTDTFTSTSLNDLCEQLLPDAEYEAQRRPCTVRLQEDAQLTLRANPELLYRALENVVRNAIRYTAPDTEVTLRLGTDGPNALIEVSDHGPGIPEADLERIFTPFYRVDESRTASTGGFGVGLAITERAVRLHGGTLRAINRPTGGTTIQLLLPLALVP